MRYDVQYRYDLDAFEILPELGHDPSNPVLFVVESAIIPNSEPSRLVQVASKAINCVSPVSMDTIVIHPFEPYTAEYRIRYHDGVGWLRM